MTSNSHIIVLSLQFHVLQSQVSSTFMLQARQSILKILRQLIEKRRDGEESHQDMLGYLMRNDDSNRHKLSDDEIIDQIITILYSGYETVSTTSMMAVKYLHDHPTVLEELRVCSHFPSNFDLFPIIVSWFFFFLTHCNFPTRKNIWESEKEKGQMNQLNGMISSQ